MRPDLPAPAARDDENEDRDYRRPGRRDFDVRRRPAQDQDEDHLRILSICYYILGGLSVLGGLFPLVYVILGIVMMTGGMTDPHGDGPPPFMGAIFAAFGGCFSVGLWVLSGCILFTGYNLANRRRYLFCFVVACICCMQVPLGTVLGVFTIIVLARPGVKELFDRPVEPAAAPVE